MFEQIIKQSASLLPKLNIFEEGLKLVNGIFAAPFGFFEVRENSIAIVKRNGKFDGFRESGLRWTPLGANINEVFVGDKTSVQNDMCITDARGNPIIVRSSVTYKISNPLNYVFNVPEPKVVDLLFESEIRKMLGMSTYDELSAKSQEILDEFVLKARNPLKLDKRYDNYGIQVEKANILDLKYSPEISKSMLVRQQALATLDARQAMVENVVELTKNINSKLDLTGEDKSKLSMYLTLSMLTDKSPTLTYDIKN